jgi:hypothetical protein
MDLFASDVGAISSGNMRDSKQESINAAIQMRNNDIANNIANLKSQEKTGEIESAVQGTIQGIMGAHTLHSGISDYKAWRSQRLTKANQLQNLKATAPEGLQGDVRMGDETESPSVQVQAQATTEPPATASPEGTSATPSSNTNPTAEEHTTITAGEDDAGGGGSLVNKGLQKITGLSEDGVDKLGRGVGAVGSVATAGLDIYEDFKDNKWKKNNGWQDASQITDMGAAIADTVAIAFPPAALVGGILSGIGAVTNEIGELFESKKEKAQKEQQQEQQKAQQQQQFQAPETSEQAIARVSA